MISRSTIGKIRIVLAVAGGCLFLFFMGYYLINSVFRFMNPSVADVADPANGALDVDLGASDDADAGRELEAQRDATVGIYTEDFSAIKTIEEVSEIESSSDSEWWVNSGAYFYQTGEIGRTLQGDLPENSKWYEQYRRTSSDSSEGGLHPQNIFRLLHRSLRTDVAQQVQFRVDANHFSDSAQRGESNGLLLFSRYVDEDNLYYGGVRVDGHIIIKKKLNGTYHTLLEEKYFNRIDTYDRDSFPTLLPQNEFFGVGTRVEDVDGGVRIEVWLDEKNNDNWVKVGEVIDDGRSFNGDAIIKEGYSGIRSDFMDVSVDNYEVRDL